MKVRDVSIKAKLLASFSLLAILVLAVSALAIQALSHEHADFSQFVNTTSARVTFANAILDAANARAIGVRNLVLVSRQSDIELEKAATTKAHGEMSELMAKLKSAVEGDADVSSTERQLFADLASVEAKYGPVALDILGKAVKGDKDGAVKKMDTDCRPLLAALVQASGKYIDYVSDEAKADVKKADASFAVNRGLMIASSVIAIAAAVALAFLITRAIVGPIGQAVALTRTVASGDLRSDIQISRKDELGELLSGLKSMNDSLVGIVSTVREGSDSIATGSAQIATGNADLSSRTEQQASSLQETAASMEQMNATVKSSAETARQATQLATSASAAAVNGGAVVAQVVSTMNDISESSRRIGDIIGVIDGIAFQTNILALNAAVEAARAGEQGRGFAVVASEVRSLAQRSAEAAKEIKTLIGASVERVNTGSKLVGNAHATMEDIVAQVKRVSDLISEIGASTEEQTAGIGQVNSAVAQLDQATQQNAALVEESAAAAESLRLQATKLSGAVGFFKLRESLAA
jgi:methyl-accepting chemotaxis protein